MLRPPPNYAATIWLSESAEGTPVINMGLPPSEGYTVGNTVSLPATERGLAMGLRLLFDRQQAVRPAKLNTQGVPSQAILDAWAKAPLQCKGSPAIATKPWLN